MKNTDGALLNAIKSISTKRLIFINTVALIIWMCSTIVFIIMNAFGVSSYNCHGVMIVLLYVSGCIGLIFGGIYLFRKNELLVQNLNITERLFPLLLLLILFVWCTFCVFFSEEKRMAIYGYESMRNCLLTFLFYIGLTIAGLTVSNEKRSMKILVSVFFLVCIFIALTILTTGFSFVSQSDITIGKDALIEDNNKYYGPLLLIACILSTNFIFNKTGITSIICGVLCITFFSSLIFSKDVISIIFYLICFFFLLLQTFLKNEYIKSLKIIGILIVFTLMFVIISILKYGGFCYIVSELLNNVSKDKKSFIDAISVISSNPVVGVGPLNVLMSANNIFLQIAMYMGFPGMILFLFSNMTLLKSMKIANDFHDIDIFLYVIVSFLLVMTVTKTMYYTLAFYFIIFGICMGKIKNEDANKSSNN